MNRLMSVQEAAERLGVSLWAVYRLARAGKLACVRLGRRRLFAEGDLEELVKSGRMPRQLVPGKELSETRDTAPCPPGNPNCSEPKLGPGN